MRRATAAIALALTLGAAGAHAQATPPRPLADALTGEALSRYDDGRARFKDGNFAGALSAFEEAYATSKDPRLLWNMAACERKLGHNGKALLLLQDYLLSAEKMITKREEQEAKESALALRAIVAQVTVRTSPHGVDVIVDGEKVGTTPLAARLYLDRGAHKVVFKKEGFDAIERSEDVAGGTDVVWTAALEPARALPAPPATPPAPLTREEPRVAARSGSEGPSRTIPWVLTMGGAALAVGGGIVTAVSYAHYDDLKSTCSPACDPSRWESTRAAFVAGEVAAAVGIVALGVGIVWLVTSPAPARAAWRGAAWSF